MISKGVIILTIGIVGTITTVVLWLISVFRTPDDIKTYFIYDDFGDITMINKTIRLNENTTKDSIESNSHQHRNESFYKLENENKNKIKASYFNMDETQIDNEHLEIDETQIDNKHLEIDETQIDNEYLEIDETRIN